MKRRDLLRGGLALGLGGVLAEDALAASWLGSGAPAIGSGRDRGVAARNIIFFALDGFSWDDLAVGQAFSRRRLGRPLALSRVFTGAGSGSSETYSLGSMVTDSSAASSTWATGRKILNGTMNLAPDGTALTSILEIARAEGRATGLITTTRITHATPAGWVARTEDRNLEDEIALQYLAFRPDVLLGGGAVHFDPARRRDGRDVAGEFARGGYTVLRTAAELDASNASRVLGLFAGSHMPFEIDRLYQDAGGPSLADLTRSGLRILDGFDNGFVVQIEAGRIDHANHHNDGAAAVWDVAAADAAFAVVLDYVDGRDDTLLIVASDHATGGGVVYGVGSFYRGSSDAFERVDRHRGSLEHLIARLGRRPTPAEVAEGVAAYFGVQLTPAQAERAAAAFRDGATASPHRTAFVDQPINTLGFVVNGGGANGTTPDRMNYNFATGQHTAAAVPLAAYGAGAAARAFGLVDNTVPYTWMCEALGVRHENPQTIAPEPMSSGNTSLNHAEKRSGPVSSA